MAFDFDMTEVEDIDSVELADATDYPDQTDPAPLPPGNYRFVVDDAARTKNQDGEFLDDNGYPQLQLSKLTIVEPEEEFKGRSIYPFQKYTTRPYQSGKRVGAVPAVDLLRGFDDSLTFKGTNELLGLLKELASSGKAFTASTGWLAKDSEYIKEAIDAAGGFENLSEEERKELFDKAFFRGQRKFPKVNGFFVPEVVGPSGETLTAKVNLTRIYPSSKVVKKMGPFKAAKVAK
jgi:hypothetical protein